MKKILYVILALLIFSPGCEKTERSDDGKLYLVATTGMIADALINIAGDKATVEALMGPGVDPHLYKASQGDLSRLREADAIFYNGLHLEGKMVEVMEKLGHQKPVIAVADGIDKEQLLSAPQYQNAHDPHIWFDLSIWAEAVAHASTKLQEIDPDHAEYYSQNAEKYLQEIRDLHNWVQQQIRSIPEQQRVLITAHDAFEYFGRAYNIEVRGLQGISTVSEFGLQDVTNMVDFIAENNINAVFVESSVSEKSLKAVVEGAKERGHQVKIGGTLYSDAMGEAGTPEGTYLGMVKANVNTIVSSLK